MTTEPFETGQTGHKKTREPFNRKWIKLFIKESLIGTMREEMSAEERGIWVDFLLLAGNSRVPGVICANENTPFTIKRISQILNIPEKLVNQCIKLFEVSDRIFTDEYGCIHITNWAKYQYSDYDRQKRYRESKTLFGTKHNTGIEALTSEELETAIEAFGPVETWDNHNWIAVTGKMPG